METRRTAHRMIILLLVAALASGCGMVGSAKVAPAPSPIKEDYSTRDYVVNPRQFVLVSERELSLPNVDLIVNDEVKREIGHFSSKRRSCIEKALTERADDIPTLKQIFRDEGVPPELVNVALLESGFNNEARSPAGATGMWQFMKSTARIYGLKIGLRVDQRKDVILSSLAAARHLRDLYQNYNDWYLALAAYNAGPGGVDRAIQRGGSRDFWTLARQGLLPEETRNFVPRFLAAALIMRDPGSYGFDEGSVSALG